MKNVVIPAKTEKSLVGRYVDGDQQALELLIRKHQSRVFSYLMTIVKDESLASDLFQDTFVKVINTIRSGSYNDEGKFINWVLRIAHNLAIDHFRRMKKASMIHQGDGDEFDIFNVLKLEVPNIEEELVTNQIYRDIRMLIEELPEEQKEVLKLRHYSEKSFKEISDITGVSINTALGRMRYALINLRKIIEEKKICLSR
jgi:RNA polymerase sigma-70 factor (ECF subfamily)